AGPRLQGAAVDVAVKITVDLGTNGGLELRPGADLAIVRRQQASLRDTAVGAEGALHDDLAGTDRGIGPIVKRHYHAARADDHNVSDADKIGGKERNRRRRAGDVEQHAASGLRQGRGISGRKLAVKWGTLGNGHDLPLSADGKRDSRGRSGSARRCRLTDRRRMDKQPAWGRCPWPRPCPASLR